MCGKFYYPSQRKLPGMETIHSEEVPRGPGSCPARLPIQGSPEPLSHAEIISTSFSAHSIHLS